MAFAYSPIINNELDLAMISLGGLLPFKNYVSYNPLFHEINKRIEDLKLNNKYIDNFLKIYSSIEYVILVNRGPVYFSGKGFGIEETLEELNGFMIDSIKNGNSISNSDAFVEGYVEIAKYLISQGKKVIFTVDVPELGFDPKECLQRLFKLSKKEPSSCALDRKIVDERQREHRQLIEKIKERVPSLLIYDPTNLFCDEKKCYGKKNDTIYYADDDHLNLEGSKILVDDFKKWFSELDKAN